MAFYHRTLISVHLILQKDSTQHKMKPRQAFHNAVSLIFPGLTTQLGNNGIRLMEPSVFCNCILCKHFAHFKHRLQLFYSVIASAKASLRICPPCCLLFITSKNAAQCLREADNPFTYFPQIRSHPLLVKTLQQLRLPGALKC